MIDWLAAPDYWLARLLLQRGVGALYLVAFVAALNQFRPLLGERGLLPVPGYLARVSFREAPSLFHWRYSDQLLAGVAWTGIVLSAAVVVGLVERAPLAVSVAVWLVLWALYLSVVNVGQVFYAFGWESLLLEAGFLVAFLGTADVAPLLPVLLSLRWLLFRVEFGAGLIKLRGDRCWRDLTCLYHHHETQPLPNGLSWYFHHLPRPLHKVEVAANHVAQLIVPFGLFLPQPVAAIAAAAIVVTQSWLLLSGNFAWLNAITIVLAFSAVPSPAAIRAPAPPAWFGGVVLAVTVAMVLLAWAPIANMASPRQVMNTSFNRLHLGNTYGAFGSITRVRHEVVIEGTTASSRDGAADWREYEFKAKPGDPRRRPRQVAPYHLRLDWLMWFAALSPGSARRWMVPLLVRLLRNDPATLKLLRGNPFPGDPPVLVRARFYRYRFTTPRERRETGDWWRRTLVGDYLGPARLPPGGPEANDGS